MTIEIAHYGLVIDSSFCYIALSWGLLTTATILAAAVYAYKLWRTK